MINHNFQEINREEISSVCEMGVLNLQNRVEIVRMTKQLHNVVCLEDSSGFKYTLPSSCNIEASIAAKSSDSSRKYSYNKYSNPSKPTWNGMSLAGLSAQVALNEWVTIKDKHGEAYRVKITLIEEKSIFWPESQINFYENKLAIVR